MQAPSTLSNAASTAATHDVVNGAAADGFALRRAALRLKVSARQEAKLGLRRLGQHRLHGRQLQRAGKRSLHQVEQPLAPRHRQFVVDDLGRARLQQAAQLVFVGLQQLDVSTSGSRQRTRRQSRVKRTSLKPSAPSSSMTTPTLTNSCLTTSGT